MTPIHKQINELWIITIKMRFFAVTHEEFDKARIINLIDSSIKMFFYKNDPNNTRNTTIIQHKT